MKLDSFIQEPRKKTREQKNNFNVNRKKQDRRRKNEVRRRDEEFKRRFIVKK